MTEKQTTSKTEKATKAKRTTSSKAKSKKMMPDNALAVSQALSGKQDGAVTTGVPDEVKEQIANVPATAEKPLSEEATKFVTNGEPVKTENSQYFKRGRGRPKSTVAKTKVTMELSNDLLARIDKIINKSGLPRTSYITIALEHQLQLDEKKAD